MGNIKLNTKVVLPDDMSIPLIRGDHAEVRNIFRIFFEVSLAFTGTMFGVLLSLEKEKITLIHWFFFITTFISTLVNLFLSFNYKKNKSK